MPRTSTAAWADDARRRAQRVGDPCDVEHLRGGANRGSGPLRNHSVAAAAPAGVRHRLDHLFAIEALRAGKIHTRLTLVTDGEEALSYLRRTEPNAAAVRPDLILLDLNLPRKSGLEVLADIKSDADLRRIPVVVLTSSAAEQDILESYDLRANCYVCKPVDLDQFMKVVQSIEDFWLTIVKLPRE